MNTYNTMKKTLVIALSVIGVLLAVTFVSAQEVTPEPAPTEAPVTEVAPVEVPTEVPPVVEVPVEVPTEVAPVAEVPVVVTEVAPVVVAPVNLDVSGVRAYFVPNINTPTVGSPFVLDLMIMNPSAVGINSVALQCSLDQVLFTVEPLMAMAVEPVPGQPVPTPIPGVFGVNAYIAPLTVDAYTNTATVTIAQTIGVPSFASGKAESFNLRATAAGVFNMNCSANVVDANGLTQAISTFPLSISVQAAPVVVVETPVVVTPDTLPVEPTPVVEVPVDVVTETVVEAAPVVEVPVEAAPVVEVPSVAIQPTTGSITGRVVASGEIIVTLIGDAGFITSVTAAPDGSFTFANIAAGIYTISADARGALPAEGTVGVMPGNTITLNTVTLVVGDLNNDNLAVDSNDTVLLTNAYNMAAASLPPELDINHDGVIGLGDLRQVSANVGQVGPTLWQ